jgi:hypothetical protein
MWGMSESRVTVVVERRDAPVRVSNDVEELCKVVHIFTPISRGEHVLGEMKYVLPLPIVGVKETLNMTPRTLDRVRISSSTLIDEIDRMVLSLVRVAMSTQIPVRRPAVADERSEPCLIDVET